MNKPVTVGSVWFNETDCETYKIDSIWINSSRQVVLELRVFMELIINIENLDNFYKNYSYNKIKEFRDNELKGKKENLGYTEFPDEYRNRMNQRSVGGHK